MQNHASIARTTFNALWQRLFRTRAEDSLPLTISHHRTYIMPSKRGLAFLFALFLILIASVNYALSLGYALCFLFTGLFAASLLHTYRNVAGISIMQIATKDTFAGEPAEFTLTLSNPSTGIRHGVALRAGDISTLTELKSNQQTQAILAMPTQSRGVCRLGRVTIQSDWPLGLWTCWSYLHVAREALVYPKPETDAPPLPSVNGAESGRLSVSTARGDVSGLRSYQEGDAIGSIAWKSAARGLGLMSRTFDDEPDVTATVLDIQRTGNSGIEAQLSRLCAWVMLAEQKQKNYAVKLPGFSLEQGRGQNQQQQALKALARHGLVSGSAA